ncbi:MAG: hypothetical protein R3E12_01740 [Candidatus Eisenbacteria bacterium]|uniref:Uncharacterized protein n=1 Tax=Eiseniibacteriota bacterium TaxID=2212470 RepID=A0A956M2N5_UNCEI|nr:hypothetical protein [Candidatus Eisenbacteria bacterium]
MHRRFPQYDWTEDCQAIPLPHGVYTLTVRFTYTSEAEAEPHTLTAEIEQQL